MKPWSPEPSQNFQDWRKARVRRVGLKWALQVGRSIACMGLVRNSVFRLWRNFRGSLLSERVDVRAELLGSEHGSWQSLPCSQRAMHMSCCSLCKHFVEKQGTVYSHEHFVSKRGPIQSVSPFAFIHCSSTALPIWRRMCNGERMTRECHLCSAKRLSVSFR